MEARLKQKLLTQFFLTQMELEKMEFNFQSKSTNGKISISERPENINVIGNEELDLIIKNDGLVNIYNLRGNQRSSTFRSRPFLIRAIAILLLQFEEKYEEVTCPKIFFSSNSKSFSSIA